MTRSIIIALFLCALVAQALGSNKDDKVQEFIKAGLDQRVAMELYDRVIMTTNINQNFTKDVVNRLVFSLKQLPANEAVNAIKSSTRIQNNNLVGDYLFHLSTLMITKNTFFSLGQLLTEVTDKLQQSGDMSVFAETKFFEKVTKEFEKIVKLAEFVFEDPRVLQHLKKMKIGDVPLEAILQHKGNVKTYL